MRINEWPAAERPREKLLASGAGALSDAEVLAVLLGSSGVRGLNVVELSRELLAQHQTLRALLNAGHHSLVQRRGIGSAGYCRLQAALELARRYYAEAMRVGPTLDSPSATHRFLITRLRDQPYELFCCLHLDNRHRLIAFDELFRGTIDGASVHPREVVRQALSRNAAAVILAHNHPSGRRTQPGRRADHAPAARGAGVGRHTGTRSLHRRRQWLPVVRRTWTVVDCVPRRDAGAR
jgi:DNA repair protein RadC